MFLLTPKHSFADCLPARFRGEFGRRAAGILLAVLIEGLFVLVVLSLGRLSPNHQKPVIALSTFTVEPAAKPAEAQHQPSPHPAAEPAPAPAKAPAKAQARHEAAQPAPAAPARPAMIVLTHEQMAAANIARMPAQPNPSTAEKGQEMGPPDLGRSKDTPRTGGSGPHGEPLYAAAWYREPYDDELRGYLSTAQGPGWGKIACRTVPDFRVDDCVIVDEYPHGSNIARAVLAASWQFRVRPPRIGGKAMIGEWVGIRIDYDIRRP